MSAAEHPCRCRCECPEDTLNPELCRDCDIAMMSEASHCVACGHFVFNDTAKGLGFSGCACAAPTMPDDAALACGPKLEAKATQ